MWGFFQDTHVGESGSVDVHFVPFMCEFLVCQFLICPSIPSDRDTHLFTLFYLSTFVSRLCGSFFLPSSPVPSVTDFGCFVLSTVLMVQETVQSGRLPCMTNDLMKPFVVLYPVKVVETKSFVSIHTLVPTPPFPLVSYVFTLVVGIFVLCKVQRKQRSQKLRSTGE